MNLVLGVEIDSDYTKEITTCGVDKKKVTTELANYFDPPYQIGDKIQACDTMSVWRAVVIQDEQIEFGQRKVLLHYIGFSAKWDEWVDVTSVRLAAAGTHALKNFKGTVVYQQPSAPKKTHNCSFWLNKVTNNLYNNSQTADCHLIVGDLVDEKYTFSVFVHKAILAAQSSYFLAAFYGPLACGSGNGSSRSGSSSSCR